MGMLSRLLGYATRLAPEGVRLDHRHAWIIPATRDAAALLRALPILAPDGGYVYFEDTTESGFASWAREHAVAAPLTVACGTIWPKPDWFHVPLTPSLMEEAAVLVDQRGIALPSIHMHVHDGAKVILEWHDAFIDDPMYVSSEISRECVEAFADRLHVGPVSADDAV